MACAGLLLVSVLAAGVPNVMDAVNPGRDLPISSSPLSSSYAEPLPHRAINLSVPGAMHNFTISTSEETRESSISAQDRWRESGATGISIGPLRTEFGGVTGRHMHLATMKLQGVDVFGGSIGASLDSRSAKITLSWPTAPN